VDLSGPISVIESDESKKSYWASLLKCVGLKAHFLTDEGLTVSQEQPAHLILRKHFMAAPQGHIFEALPSPTQFVAFALARQWIAQGPRSLEPEAFENLVKDLQSIDANKPRQFFMKYTAQCEQLLNTINGCDEILQRRAAHTWRASAAWFGAFWLATQLQYIEHHDSNDELGLALRSLEAEHLVVLQSIEAQLQRNESIFELSVE
jgi:hypothetical protein